MKQSFYSNFFKTVNYESEKVIIVKISSLTKTTNGGQSTTLIIYLNVLVTKGNRQDTAEFIKLKLKLLKR